MSDLKGNSKEAIVKGQFNVEVQKEKSIEYLTTLISQLAKGSNDIEPIVIGTKDGKIIVEKCIVDEFGSISLPELKLNSKQDIENKSKFVRKILKKISPVIHSEIDNVTFIALMRKDLDKLNLMLEQINKGVTPKLENRVGCIWLIVGELEFII